MTKLRAIGSLVAMAVALAGCEKNALQTIDVPATGARVMFFNMAVNAPGVNFYGNDAKLTATTSTIGVESSIGTTYGNVAAGARYTAVAPGQVTLNARLSDTTQRNVVMSSLPVSVADGKFYSYYTSGVYNTTTKTSDAFVVEDLIPADIQFNASLVRFVNAIYNSSPMTLYAKNTSTGQEYVIGGTVAYKGAGAYVEVPVGFYDLSTRVAGSSTNVIVRTAVQLEAGRVHTITAKGDMTITSATPAPDRRPGLDNTINR